jgi:nicotinate (nicotinamide) nucleotide adenylyltransferase
MIKEAIKPYPKLKILEVEDKQFEVKKTLPKLQNYFFDQQLVFLFGSDKLINMYQWPHFDYMLRSSEFIVGSRQADKLKDLKLITKSWPTNPNIKFIRSYAPDISSSVIRDALYDNKMPKGLLQSVNKYIRQNWLYVSLR